MGDKKCDILTDFLLFRLISLTNGALSGLDIACTLWSSTSHYVIAFETDCQVLNKLVSLSQIYPKTQWL